MESDPVVVALRGQLDVDSAPDLYATVDALRKRAVHRVVVDLGGLTFCDSVGLSSFVIAHKYCTETGGYLRLAAPAPFLAKALSVVGVAGVIPVYRTVDGARTGDREELVAHPQPGLS